MTGAWGGVAASAFAAGLGCGLVAGLQRAEASIAGVYDVVFDTARSGLTGDLGAQARTAGVLIGNYDPVENPAGTRTKPGLFGTFGSTENVPVSVTLTGNAGGPIETGTSGGFRLSALADGAVVSGFAADLLSGGTLALPLSITLTSETFRTRNPTFIYPGGVPITVPLGEATVTQLRFEQIGAAPATLSPQDDGSVLLESSVLALFTARLDLLGNVVDIPGAPIALPISASLRETAGGFEFAQSRPIEFQQSAAPGVDLPSIPFALPTLSPDAPANVTLSLRLEEIATLVNGTWTIAGGGTPVPAPGSLGILYSALAVVARRRRR